MVRLRNLALATLLLVCLSVYLFYSNAFTDSVVEVVSLRNYSTSVRFRLRNRRPPELPLETTGPSEHLFLTEDADDPKFRVSLEGLTIENGDDAQSENVSSLKKILFWNENSDQKHFGFGFGRAPFVRAGCRVDGCMTTGARDRFRPEELDAVVWHFRSKDRTLPEKRSPHTRYVFWVMESASYLYGDISASTASSTGP
nr:uncharacterized protein LOC113817002 [Penaeus vannamei]